MTEIELHSHLYGCLEIDDLKWLYSRNEPRWEIFRSSYQNAFGSYPDIERLKEDSPDREEAFRQYYHNFASGDFAAFQSAFDLIIALSKTDTMELREASLRVLSRRSGYTEQRMMFSPLDDISFFKEKVHALCEAFAEAEKSNSGLTPRLAMSIWRLKERGEKEFHAVQEILGESEIARRYLVGLDFCAQEESFPPREKTALFAAIKKHNENHPERSLAVLYHVGESFKDKSVESAARWVLESARMGAHRLGHALALGIPASYFLGKRRREIVSERIDQIEFEIREKDSLKEAGYMPDHSALEKEKTELAGKEGTVEIFYDENRVRSLELFQNWAMEQLKKTSAVIESCPSSNLRIGGLDENHHPLRRFVNHGLKVVIGSDDPGILNTSLENEFRLIRAWGFSETEIQRLKKTAEASKSMLLSGRKEGR